MYATSLRTLRPYVLRRHLMFLVLALPLALSVCSQRASSECREEHQTTGDEQSAADPAAHAATADRGCGQRVESTAE